MIVRQNESGVFKSPGHLKMLKIAKCSLTYPGGKVYRQIQHQAVLQTWHFILFEFCLVTIVLHYGQVFGSRIHPNSQRCFDDHFNWSWWAINSLLGVSWRCMYSSDATLSVLFPQHLTAFSAIQMILNDWYTIPMTLAIGAISIAIITLNIAIPVKTITKLMLTWRKLLVCFWNLALWSSTIVCIG